MSYSIKQVIVVRRDLKMRRGKEAAQVAHAAMKFLADAVTGRPRAIIDGSDGGVFLSTELYGDEWKWLTGPFAKVVVSVDSLEELEDIADEARERRLIVNEIIDAGKTEFNGVPTKTCIAIGPAKSEEIDRVTGHLKLR